MTGRTRWATLCTVGTIAAYVVLFRLGAYGEMPTVGPQSLQPQSRLELHAIMFRVGRLADTYAAFYPTMVYGLRSIRDGGQGLWWNPFQNCGQPFLGRITATQLYPPYLLSFAVSDRLALWLIPFIHLIVAGLSSYLLCRELGAGRTAALCGAVAFELGNATMETTVWQPHVSGSYVWLPAAMLFCERTLRRPTAADAIGLAFVLALALLAGFPQAVFYAYQLILLRVTWELARGSGSRRAAAPVAIGVALLLGPLIAGLQEIPALEITRAARAGAPLSPAEIAPWGFLDWQDFRRALGARASVFQPLALLPWMLSVPALLAPATRRRALFYVIGGLGFFLLALGPTTPFLGWYLKLPFGTAFRHPERFMWVTSFCLAVVAALGVEAVLSPASRRSPGAVSAGMVALVGALGTFHLLAPDGLRPLEWALAGLAIGACLSASVAPILRGAAGVVVFVTVLANLVAVPVDAWRSLLISGSSVLSYGPTFARLRARMTAQDRVYFNFNVPFSSAFGLQAKSASVFEIPSLFDYEPQTARRYAEFFTELRTGAPIPTAGFFASMLGGASMPHGFNRRLLDLAAGRYVLAEAIVDNTAAVLDPPPPLLEEDNDVRLYGNPQALPRARYVPHVAVVEDGPSLLRRLAAGTDDPRQVALVEAPPGSGFTGVEGNTAAGTAEFLRNDPEHLVLRVEAPARGFVVLADQHFPGWEATVNGEARPIVRANYVFRLVEVPAGASRVEFRYVPTSVRLGAWVSALALLGVGWTLTWSFVHRRVHGTGA